MSLNDKKLKYFYNTYVMYFNPSTFVEYQILFKRNTTIVQMDFMTDLEVLFHPRLDDSIDTSSLGKFNENGSKVFYPTQIKTARELISKFTSSQLVLLLAQMQSGKTGAFLCTSCAMVHFGIVDQVIVFTGVPDTDLYRQLEQSVVDAVTHFNDVMECDITGKVITKKASKLPDTRISPKTLVVWDEAHYAQDVNNRPFQMFQNNGLLVDGTSRTNDLWKAKDCYLLTVSATPFSEYIDYRDSNMFAEITKEMVAMQPGPSYRGVSYFHEHNMILSSWNIMSRDGQHKFVDLLRKAKTPGKPKYGILRSRADAGDIRMLAEHAGWNKFIFYDMKNRTSMPLGWQTLEDAPTEDTLVVLKNMGRLGQVVPKQHIAFVFESTTGSGSTDTILQSLLGRMCGYYDIDPCIQIFVPSRLTSIKDIDDIEGNEVALEARITLRKAELEDLRIATIRGNEFSLPEFEIPDFEVEHAERVKREIENIKREHYECIEYATASEISRYVNLVNRRCDDVPRYAKNIRRSQLDQKKVGMVGYSTVPMQIKLDISNNDISAYTELEKCAVYMNESKSNRGNKKEKQTEYVLGESQKMNVVRELIGIIETEQNAFGDNTQRMEILTLLKAIIAGKFTASEIINFGDLNSKTGQIKSLRKRMHEAIRNNMPYVDAVKQKQWRKKESEGAAKRLQFFICSKVEHTSDGVADFDTTQNVYFTGYTYDANEETKDAHKRMTIPATTRHEAFHHTHELNTDIASTWLNVIKDEDAFMGMIDTEFPAGKRIRILPTQSIPDMVIHHLDQLCLCNNGRFSVQRITSKRTREDKALGSRIERYVVFFHQRTKLSIV